MSSPNLPLAIANAVPLSPVATQTANTVAGTNQLIPVDSSTIPVIVTLPNAPADKTRVLVKKIDASANNVGVQTAGSDVFNKSGGSTTVTLSLQNQSVSLQYANPAGIWYVTSSDLPLSVLDGRYSTAANVTAAIQAQATSDMATYTTLAQALIAWTQVQAFQVVSATRDANEAITTASVVWPDGATGTFTTDTASTSFPGAIDAYHVTHVLNGTTKTVTQTAVTRDAGGAVTAQPALTVA